MTSNRKFSINDGIDSPMLEEEIKLKPIFYSLSRNKTLITKFILAGLILGGLYAFTQKRVWQGEFQIVLENREQQSSLPINQNILNLPGLGVGKNELATEVGILKSPSVLISIFEYVSTQKSIKTNRIQNLRFNDWKDKSLDVELAKGTSILNLAYRDTDKDLVLPVLNRISSTYQEYSGRKRLRNIELGINYFENQIEVYKDKSLKSLQKAQQFAIDQDLSIIEGDAEMDKEIKNVVNIESIRIKASEQIRVIDQQLVQIQNLKDKSDQIMYIASTIESLTPLANKLKDIDTDLARLRVTYKEYDTSIKDLLKERIFLIELLKRRVTGFLTAQKDAAQARLKAAERPEGVLIKYKQLLSNASKDKSTLDQLENQYRVVLLEKARSEDPWELITTPTLLPFPVAPRRKLVLAFSLLAGGVIGSGVALIADKRKDIVYSLDEMESLGNWPLLAELSMDPKHSWGESLDLMVSGPLSVNNGNIALIAVGEIDDLLLSKLNKSLGEVLQNREFKITKDLREASKCSNLIVISAMGVTKKQELIELRKKLYGQNSLVVGLMALNNIDLKT